MPLYTLKYKQRAGSGKVAFSNYKLYFAWATGLKNKGVPEVQGRLY
jgi:hypothetical protein